MPNNFALTNPNPIVDKLRSNVGSPTSFMAWVKLSLLAMMMIKKIMTNNTVEAVRMGFSILSANASRRLRIIIPIEIGITVITKICSMVSNIGSWITTSVSPVKYAMAFDKRIGMVNTVMRLAKAVSVTESPIFPRETCDIKLLVGPPGHKERIITPMAIVGLRSNNTIIANPMSGRNNS